MTNEHKVYADAPKKKEAADLFGIAGDVAREWLFIILFSAAASLLAFSCLTIAWKPAYKSVSNIAIRNYYDNVLAVNSSAVEDYEILNEGIDSATRITTILTGEDWVSMAREFGYSDIKSKVVAENVQSSNLITITVESDSPLEAYNDNMAIISLLQTYSQDLVGGFKVNVLQYPEVPESVADPNQVIKYSVFAGLVTFMLVIIVLIIRSFLHDAVHSRKEAEGKINVPILMTAPYMKKTGGAGSKADNYTKERADRINLLAGRVINEMDRDNSKILLVAGTSEGEGTSATAADLARAISENRRKVILVDMDFRKPSLYRMLNMEKGDFTELSSVVGPGGKNSSARVSDLICTVPDTHFQAVLNRTAVPNAVETRAERIGQLLSVLADKADYVIIDSAPFKLQPDMEELALMADKSLISIRTGLTSAGDINDMISVLGGKEYVLGGILNDNGFISQCRSKIGSRKAASYGGSYAG